MTQFSRPRLLRLILGLLGLISAAIAVAVLPVGGSGRVEAVGATSCVGEQYDWLGRAELTVGQSFATGVAVPAVAGAQIVVSALSFSAEPFATSIVNVTVGGAAVLEDALLPGGEIVVSNIGAAPLVLTTVGVAIQRCGQVDQAPPPPPPISAPSGPLPQTGRSLKLGVAGSVCLVGGLVLLCVSRRRRPLGYARET